MKNNTVGCGWILFSIFLWFNFEPFREFVRILITGFGMAFKYIITQMTMAAL